MLHLPHGPYRPDRWVWPIELWTYRSLPSPAAGGASWLAAGWRRRECPAGLPWPGSCRQPWAALCSCTRPPLMHPSTNAPVPPRHARPSRASWARACSGPALQLPTPPAAAGYP